MGTASGDKYRISNVLPDDVWAYGVHLLEVAQHAWCQVGVLVVDWVPGFCIWRFLLEVRSNSGAIFQSKDMPQGVSRATVRSCRSIDEYVHGV